MQACCLLTCPMHWMSLVPGIHGTKTMILEPEEAVFKVDCGLCNTVTRRPYGELGSVDKVRYGCCIGVGSELTQKMPICPGNGCNEPLVDEIVADLKRRMKARGDTGQIKRAEQLLGEIQILKAQAQSTDAKLNAILKHLNIEAPPTAAAAVTQQPLA